MPLFSQLVLIFDGLPLLDKCAGNYILAFIQL